MFLRYIVMILILALIGVFLYPEKPRKTISSIPEVAFTLPSGEESSLSDFKGKITLVHFWASWCPPCVMEMPQLVKLAKSHHDDINIIAFSLDKSAADMNRFMQSKFTKLPNNFITIWDRAGAVARNKFYSFSYPETYIVGCDGSLRTKISGVASNWESAIKPHLESCNK